MLVWWPLGSEVSCEHIYVICMFVYKRLHMYVDVILVDHEL